MRPTCLPPSPPKGVRQGFTKLEREAKPNKQIAASSSQNTSIEPFVGKRVELHYVANQHGKCQAKLNRITQQLGKTETNEKMFLETFVSSLNPASF